MRVIFSSPSVHGNLGSNLFNNIYIPLFFCFIQLTYRMKLKVSMLTTNPISKLLIKNIINTCISPGILCCNSYMLSPSRVYYLGRGEKTLKKDY